MLQVYIKWIDICFVSSSSINSLNVKNKKKIVTVLGKVKVHFLQSRWLKFDKKFRQYFDGRK